MRQIRVVSLGLSRFRTDIVRRALARPDVVLIDSVDEAELIDGAQRIDVAVVGAEGDQLPAICGILLHTVPRIKMLVIQEEGGDTTLYELRVSKVRLGNVTEDELVAAVRGASGLER